jgi:hypothetical protein
MALNSVAGNRYCAIILCLSLLQTSTSLLAQNAPPSSQVETTSADKATETVPTATKPAPLITGKTTLEDARRAWETSGANIIGAGKLAIGGGSGADGMSQVRLDQVDLIDVSNVDFEGLPVARYAFVDGVLYAIMTKLEKDLSKNNGGFKILSREEQESFKKELIRKYGHPSQSLKDMYGLGKKEPNVFIWDRKENELVLSLRYGLGSNFTISNKALAKKVEMYRKAECKKHRPTQPGPITQVCV